MGQTDDQHELRMTIWELENKIGAAMAILEDLKQLLEVSTEGIR